MYFFYEWKEHGHFSYECPKLENERYMKNVFEGNKKVLLYTWDQYYELFDKEGEHANVALMTSTSLSVELNDTTYDDNDEDEISIATKLKYHSWYLDNECSRHMEESKRAR